MPASLQFHAALQAADRGGAYVTVPAEVVTALGGGGRIPVQATFDGVRYRGSVVSMGGGRVIGVLKSIRSQLGKEIGDTVEVTLARDEVPREVTLAADVDAAFRAAGVFARFRALSFTHQREHIEWIESAKRADTRTRRIAATVDRLGA